MTVATIDLPAPHQRQEAVYWSPKRFKLLHHGRRWGKDRVALTSAVAGHGPDTPTGPTWPGAAQGWWIGWVVRDFTQGRSIWLEEFLPRFAAAKPAVSVNRAEMRVTLPGDGGLFLCTDQNIQSLRGLGKRMKGLVVNEAAHFDLEAAWLSVLRPLLVDNRGWAIIMSTPNGGHDGNALKATPSYFNRLCLQTLSGAEGCEDWGVWGGDLRDNPTIDPDEAAAFVRSYPAGSVRQREEVFGELVESGVGRAFPEWSPDVHLAPAVTIPSHYRWQASMDWGLRAPSVIHLTAHGTEDEVLVAREWTWTDKDAYDAGYDFGTALLSDDRLPGWPRVLWVDSAMVERTGVGGKTILGEFQAGIDDALRAVAEAPPLPCVGIPKGPGSRVLGYNLMAKALAWGPRAPDGALPPHARPRLRVLTDGQGRPVAPMLCGELASLLLDPTDNREIAPDQADHAYDACRYGLMGWAERAVRPVQDVPADRHPGLLPNGVRRSRDQADPEVRRREAELVYRLAAQQAGQQVDGRYGRRPWIR